MSSRPDQPRLEIRGLHKGFGSRIVLDGLFLAVEPGSVVLLAGSNGSGKTTLLRCVAGLASYEGEVLVDGQPWGASPGDRKQLGYLPQALGLPEWATVAEVLRLFARLRHCDPATLALPEGFLPSSDQRIADLSGGQQQRVAIAVTLLGGPRVLLLDEPAANLDEDGRQDLFAILDAQRRDGVSVLVAAPSPIDLNGLPDRTVRLDAGRVVPLAAGLQREPQATQPHGRLEPRHIEEVAR